MTAGDSRTPRPIPPAGRGHHVSTRRFELHRDRDISGVSGTGVVADGVVWPDGSVSIRWRGDRPSVVFWHSLDDAEQVHGHGGATRFVWLDNTDPDLMLDLPFDLSAPPIPEAPALPPLVWCVPDGADYCPRCKDTNYESRSRICITCTWGDPAHADGQFASGWAGSREEFRDGP